MKSRVETALKQWNDAVSHVLENNPQSPLQSKPNSNANSRGESIDISSPSIGNINGVNESEKHKCMRPWEKTCFLHRLNTYSPSTWFGKPENISKKQCALRGWENTDWDSLKCNVCQTELRWESQKLEPTRSENRKDNKDRTTMGEDVITILVESNNEAKLAGEFAQKLSNAHSKYCPWYMVDSSLIDHLLTPDVECGRMNDEMQAKHDHENDGQYIYSSVRNHLNTSLGI